MTKLKLLNLIFLMLLIAFTCSQADAQDDPGAEIPDRPPMDEPVNRGDLLRELGLTQDQIRQIRLLNAERRPLMQEAQRRLRVASRNLDQAIYADAVDEAAIQLRLKEVQLAQAEVAKIKATNELEVRKILTPDQLTRFREIRERMLNRLNERKVMRDQMPGQRRPNNRPLNDRPPNDLGPNPPNRRPNNRPKP